MNGETIKQKATTTVLIKSGFWYTLSSFLSKAMGFITTPIFARLLTHEQYGNFTVFASWQVILLTVCGLEVYQTINRARFDFQEGKEIHSYMTSCLVLSTALTAVVFVFYMLFKDFFYKILLIDHKYMLIMFLYLFAYPAYAMFQFWQRTQYKYKLSASISFCIIFLSLLLSVALTNMMVEDRLNGRITGQFLPTILIGFWCYLLFLKKSRTVHTKYIRYAFRMAIPLVFSYLGSNILMASDSLVVKHMCSGAEVSYLSITHSCTHIVLILVQTINNAWQPWFYDKLAINRYKTIQKTLSIYIGFILVATFGVLLIAPEIIMILGGKNYMEAIYILPACILNGFMAVLTYQFVNLETFHKKPEYAAFITGTVAVFNIGLNILGVMLFGYQAVCYVTVICQILLVAIHYRVTLKMNISNILPIKHLMLFIGSALLLIPMSLLLYQNNTIRWIFIAAVAVTAGVLIVLKRSDIIKFISQFRKKKANENTLADVSDRDIKEDAQMSMKDIRIVTKEQCAGCGTCMESCPQKAITFKPDEEGFPSPVIDESLCVQCGICLKNCPAIHPPKKSPVKEAYAAQRRDKILLKESTSGGMFAVLAEETIRSGGAVYGCVWDDQYNAVIRKAEQNSQLISMKGSKYVWSWAGDVFPEVRTLLEEGKEVLFTGLPCQVAGLRKYLGREYDHLYLIDFLCSGTPSPLAFRKYLEVICPDGNYSDLNLKFRDKDPYGVGVHITYNGKKPEPRGEHITNPYYYAFFSHLLNRRSCYRCPYSSDQRVSDITISDFWGIKNHHQEMDIQSGVSAVMINTDKGEKMLESVRDKLELIPSKKEYIAEANRLFSEENPRYRTIPPKREAFFAELSRNGWQSASKKYIHDTEWFMKWIKVKAPRTFLSKIKKVMKR